MPATETDHHFVYILECSDGSYYTGYTNHLEKRLAAHQSGKGAKYTRGRGPVALIYSEAYSTKEEAMKREYAIKQLSKEQKRSLVEGGEGNERTSELSRR
ncbi:UPF0213 protein [Pullulanibacillus camelliae]|uniref:UPF0213 protein n=1 Tax=Pullulanibacillus camelliae TaxID=1707096 RepID=A0A8J3DYR3_9BACL|nr:GIY-YIG nuclease family protein [Pullulanibacillus camelliae]GGE53908.1 UPF0213 protein [Pullulanibacillus camelliae]